MSKQMNLEWMQSLVNNDRDSRSSSEESVKLDWVQVNKGFKRSLKFKMVPANSRENNVFSFIVGTHWNLGPNKDKRIICPEQTGHLSKQNVVCPVCEAKRQLLAAGFTEEELSTQGKYGLIPVFDPTVTSNMKVVVLESDAADRTWDKAHISILQQKGSYPTKWMVEEYMNKDNPDFLLWEKSNIVSHERATDNGKWDRKVTFATFEPSMEVIAKLKEENEAFFMPDIWRMPSDQEFLEIRQLVNDMKENYFAARQSVAATATSAVTAGSPEDNFPF